jgi:hypothetical protein
MLFTACSPKDPAVHDELGSYHEFSVLQNEYEKRSGKSVSDIEFFQYEALQFAALPSLDGKGVVLVLLNPQASPYYKQYPPGPYNVSGNALDEMQRRAGVSATVLECVKSHVQRRKP